MPDGTVPPIDWDCDGVPNDVGVSVDLNGNGQTQEVHDPTGTADWINLFYEFQCETTYADLTSGQLASGVQERQYRELGFDLRPPLIARLDVQPLCVDVAGGGAIPATIFGSATLDVSMIDLSAMRLGAASMSPVSVRTGDFDGDGWQDLKADFLQGPLTIAGTDFWLHATGTLLNGRTFNARDVIEPDHQSRDCDTRGSMPMTDEEVDASGR
jgi:hypothetical protein